MVMLCERMRKAPNATPAASSRKVASGPTQRLTWTIEATSITGSEITRKKMRNGIGLPALV